MRNRIPPLTPIALAVALAIAAPHAVFATPVGATVVAGQVQVSQPNAQTMLVTQGSDKAIVNWRSFSIGAGETVRFQQPNSNSVALNRVTTATPSEIFGRLSANGKVFLVNSSGVMFGRGASVDVGGLVASTLDIADDDFLDGRYAFGDRGGHAGAVRNEGTLSAAERGTIALLGAQVSNNGSIRARLGTVGLAAGGKVSLDFNGDGLTRIVVDAARLNALVDNGGAVIADGGQVSMTARALGALADSVVRQNGVVQAHALVERNGRIVLDGGSAGKVELAGTLDAAGLAAGRRGGDVTVLGRDIALAGTASIDVRGDAGGGTVLAGGDYQGGNPLVPHAASTAMAPGATIRADALGSGNGGKVILWSDGLTSAAGTLSANGGAQGGDGGLVETSGKTLDVAGSKVSAASPTGRAGRWLLDPTDIAIDQLVATSISQSLNNGTDVTVSTHNGTPSADTGVIDVHGTITKTAGGDTTLLFEADNILTLWGDAHIVSTAPAGKLHVVLNSDVDGVLGGAVVMEGGASILTNGGDVRIQGQTSSGVSGATDTFDGVALNGALIDTRTALGNAGASGIISIAGKGDGVDGGIGVRIVDTSLLSSTGAITITGTGGDSSGSGNVSDGVDIYLTDGALIASPRAMMTIAGTGGRQGRGVAITLDGANMSAGQMAISGTGTSGPGIRAILLNGATIGSTNGTLAMTGTGGAYDPGLDVTLRDARIAATGGDVQLSGTGGNAHASGVIISSADEDDSDGSSGAGGIMTASTARISADHGSLSIVGTNIAASVTPGAETVETAVALTGLELTTIDGDIRIAGVGIGLTTGYSTGVALKNVLAATASSSASFAPGDIVIQGVSSSPLSPGLMLDGVTLGGANMRGDIILGARNSGTTPMIAFGANSAWNNSVRSSGLVNIRPDDQGLNFGVPATAIPISVGGTGGDFNISFAGLGIGAAAPSNVVVGSREHTGAISFNDPTPILGNLVLQNDGAGSAGIVLSSNLNVSGQLTLSSGGSVDAAGSAISAATLLLHGAQPESNFQLTNAGNSVSRLGIKFDAPKSLETPDYGDVNFTNSGALRIGSVTGAGISSVTGAAHSIDATNSVVAGDLLARASGNLALAGSISTLGSDITLVTGGVFDSGGYALAPAAGDKWRVFADTWVGENRSGVVPDTPRPNYYNCAYGAPCAGAITGNRFIYRAQPTVTLTANNLARPYGNPNPLLTYTQAGLVNGDTLAGAVSGAYATAATQSSAQGAYPVTGAFTSPVGYAIVVRPGTLTIDRAALLISIDSKSKVYGDADPLLSASVSGFVLGDTAAVVSGLTLSAPTGAAATAGTHAIIGANALAANYTIGYLPGTLTVAKAALVAGADNKRKRYGDPEPLLTASISGLKYGDTGAAVTGLTLASATGAAASAGTHPIVAANGTAANYSLSYLPGVLSVDKAILLVAADNKAKVYGAAEPVLTSTISGFKYADTSAAVSGLTLQAPAGAAAGAGSHPIVAANAAASNYAFAYVPGVLAVDPAVLTYVADATIQFQDNPARPITGSVSGFVYGDALAGATTGVLAFTAQATPRSPPGVYAVQGAGLAAANYRFVQAASNEVALRTIVSPAIFRPTLAKDITFESSNVYEKNFGSPRLCVGTGPLGAGSAAGEGNDLLALEWSRVRVSPNLSNCLGLGQRNSCQDF